MTDPDPDETFNNKYAPEGWGADVKAPSHLRPQAAGEYLTAMMVPKVWKEIHEMQRRMRKWPVK